MNIFRKLSWADSTGDAIPLFHDGVYHIFSLTSPPGTTVYPARLRTTWEHSVSRDLVNWQDVGTALFPGEGEEPDACGAWTGGAIYAEGNYHIFYTGYNYHIHYPQTICHAVSKDGIHFEKDKKNPIIIPDEKKYEVGDFRDPYVFYNQDDQCYWILISARKKEGPPSKRGCIVLYRSKDLISYEYYGPLYQPYHTNCPECCEMYKIGKLWYLSYSRFSEFVNTIYRVSDSPFGPFRTPKADGIGGRRFYAAKSMENDQGRRFYFGWAHDRADRNDFGAWYWGGQFCIPHEVSQNEAGELDVKLPVEYSKSWNEPVIWSYRHIWGNHKRYGEQTIYLDSPETLSYGFFDTKEKSFLFSCKVKPSDMADYFGLLLKSDADAAQCLILAFDKGMQRVSLLNLPMAVDPFWEASCTNIGRPKEPGPDGIRVCEKPFRFADEDIIDLKVIIDKDMIEIFAGEKIAFTYRFYGETEYEIGLISQDGKAGFFDISLTK